MNFDVWNVLVIFEVLLVGFASGYPTVGKPQHKDVYGVQKNDANRRPDRRQNIIHAGPDYGTSLSIDNSKLAPDELENLGKIIDYNGKIIEQHKKGNLEYKAFNKDVIERIMSLQDSLINKTGTTELAEKLSLMLPDKAGGKVSESNVSKTPEESNVNASRKTSETQDHRSKIIPEEVVDKIIKKFQELREQAKNLAVLEKTKKEEEDVETSPKVAQVPKVPKVLKVPKVSKVVTGSAKLTQEKNPYASIGPTKDNEELKNVSLTTETFSSDLPHSGHAEKGTESNEESDKPHNNGGTAPLESQHTESRNMMKNMNMENPVTGSLNAFQNFLTTNTVSQGNTKPSQGLTAPHTGLRGGLPVMFVKTGQMLVPVFGEPNGAIAPAPGQILSNTANSFNPMVAQSQMQPYLMPQYPAHEEASSRSTGSFSDYKEIPSVPLSLIQSLMAGPNAGMLNNIPAVPNIPPQMNGGIFNAMTPNFQGQHQQQPEQQQQQQQQQQHQQNFQSPDTQAPRASPFQLPSTMTTNFQGSNAEMLNNIPAIPNIPPQMRGGIFNAMTPNFLGEQQQQQQFFQSPSIQAPGAARFQLPSTTTANVEGPNAEMLNNVPAIPGIPPQMNGGIFNAMTPNFQSEQQQQQQYFQSPEIQSPGPPPYQPPSLESILGQTPSSLASSQLSSVIRDLQKPPNFNQGQGNSEQRNMMTSSQNMLQEQQLSKIQDQQANALQDQMKDQLSMMQVSPELMQGRSGGNNDMQQNALSMNAAGQVSLFNAISQAGISPPAIRGPLPENPYQDSHPEAQNNLDLMNKEQQMLNPRFQAPVNDLSDPFQTPAINPDSLLEVARYRSTEEALNPQTTTNAQVSKMMNPESLLDTVQGRDLTRSLLGAGDPAKFIPTQRQPDPFARTSPDGLLEYLSKGNARGFKQHLNEGLLDIDGSMRQRNTFDVSSFQPGNGYNSRRPQRRYPFSTEKNENGRSRTIESIVANGMQGTSSLPASNSFGHSGGFGDIDPSIADEISAQFGRGQIDVQRKSVAAYNGMETPQAAGQFSYPVDRNSMSVIHGNQVQYEQAKNAIDSNQAVTKYLQEQASTRQNIAKPTTGKGLYKKTQTKDLLDDNIKIKVNGRELAERGSLRSKIVDGKMVKGTGKTLMSKGPVRIELSHSDDNKKTKIVNIITSTKFNVTDSRRNNIFTP